MNRKVLFTVDVVSTVPRIPENIRSWSLALLHESKELVGIGSILRSTYFDFNQTQHPSTSIYCMTLKSARQSINFYALLHLV